jgi:hypothetical protein
VTVLNPEFQKYIFLKEELKEDLKPGLPGLVTQFMMVRDFLICLFTLVFLDSPLLQIIPNLLMFLITTAMIFKFKPFSNKLMTFLTLVNELGYIVL